MQIAWRIVRAKHAHQVASGQGAAKAGGRWNSRGTAMIYTSQSQALAALEILVHLNPFIQLKYKIARVHFPEALIERLPINKVPPDWRTLPPPPLTKKIGDRWVREARSAIMQVPSVIVPEESNFLLNPRHKDFNRIRFDKADDFVIDPRLL